MIFNVTVDLSDFYTEEEGQSFSQAIKDYIAYDVKTKVLADFKAKTTDEFQKVVIAEIEKQKEGYIVGVLSELVTTAKVKKRYSSDEKISIAEYITEELERTTLSDSKVKDFLTGQTKKATDAISKELKERYDLLFASQIVSKLHENGMLKDDVAKLLLTQ
jgi:hypothetical protein